VKYSGHKINAHANPTCHAVTSHTPEHKTLKINGDAQRFLFKKNGYTCTLAMWKHYLIDLKIIQYFQSNDTENCSSDGECFFISICDATEHFHGDHHGDSAKELYEETTI
jgi:hypothetical protein